LQKGYLPEVTRKEGVAFGKSDINIDYIINYLTEHISGLFQFIDK